MRNQHPYLTDWSLQESYAEHKTNRRTAENEYAKRVRRELLWILGGVLAFWLIMGACIWWCFFT